MSTTPEITQTETGVNLITAAKHYPIVSTKIEKGKVTIEVSKVPMYTRSEVYVAFFAIAEQIKMKDITRKKIADLLASKLEAL